MAEYLIFQDKYFITKALHEMMLIAISAVIMFATASQLLVFSYHSFGMFKIASYRIEHSIEDSVLHVLHPKKEYAIYNRIMHAVIAHRRALELVYRIFFVIFYI
ncbi:PREDICTED: uncharacterized protein LOC105459991 [Wasmannia auropunctata]|uniref:uncharacterized protein LOC105459991 n=1 Tax=Wasmannia auropunctata TaxID=64793 RepID=UPI0005EDA37B|nr:PREDICTED: uncharacterized protein LOC105459991 [Wasmannia auropunctata]